MTKTKKINLFICSLLVLLASLFFASCGQKDYSNVSLTSSVSSLKLDVGQETDIVFTINNMTDDMSNDLSFSYSNEGVIKEEVVLQNGNQITVRLTAVSSDITTMTATTKDGYKSCDVTLEVNKYSGFIQPGQNSLYVSSQSVLQPSPNDFIFEDDTSEKQIDYYFYGVNNGYSLTLNNVSTLVPSSDGIQIRDFYNNFVSVKLITVQKEIEQLSYLIFTDKQGNEFTLDNGYADLSLNGNKKFNFLPVETINGQYNIPQQAFAVGYGDKFSFVANYQSASGEEIFTQREFLVLKDINSNSILKEYEYVIFNTNSGEISDEGYFIEGFSSEQITLVPNYTIEYQRDSKVDFKRVKLQITINDSSSILQSKFSSSNLFNVSQERIDSADKTIFVYNISAKTQVEQDTTFDVTFFYDGFYDSADQNVSYTISIPVSIKNKPDNIVISGADFSNTPVSNKIFTFYNHYIESADVGWQRFYFNVLPIGSQFENLTIFLQESDGLIIRYGGKEYTSGNIIVDNLNSFVEFKGKENASITDNGQIEIVLKFNLLYQDSLTTTFNYKILQGSTIISYEENFASYAESGFAFSLNNDAQGVDFSNKIYTDAEFNDFSVKLISGLNVIDFVKSDQIYQEINDRYYLNFYLIPTAPGNGTYSITLPNGFSIPLKVSVVESLNTISIQTTNHNANMSIVSLDENGAVIYARNNTQSIFDRNNFDLEIIANENENSTAMRQFSMDVEQEDQIITFANRNEFYFEVNLNSTGIAIIKATITGYNVENFVINENYQLTYTITIISYEYIDDFTINKLRDGQNSYQTEETPDGSSARYVYIYNNNANSISRKQVELQIDVSNFNQQKPAFLFRSPQNSSYVAETFSNKFVEWTVPGYSLMYNGEVVNSMYIRDNGSSIYQIVNSLTGAAIAKFDAQELLLTLDADAEGVNSFSLVASIAQFDTAKRSFTINVTILDYDAVEGLSSLSPISSLEFSSLNQQNQINLRVIQNTAINKNVVVSVSGVSVVYAGKTYQLFGEDNQGIEITQVGNAGNIVSITLNADTDFVQAALNDDFFGNSTFQANLTIAAADWYDDSGLFIEENRNRLITIPITYANGTKENRFTVDSSEDLAAINKNLAAHYQITTTINVEGIELPLGELSGSIVGTNDYAIIEGISIKSLSDGKAGLFSSIKEGAYIENLRFVGSINIEETIQPAQNAYIGLIAGINQGEIKNVSVKLDKSQINISGLSQENIANLYIGGLVGFNDGQIIQDFSESESYRLYSYLFFSNDLLNIEYSLANVYAGGIAGYSKGVIKKIDKQIFNGYTNYISYALISADLIQEGGQSQSYVGAIAGKVLSENNGDGIIAYNGETLYTVDNYSAGKGVVVGGEVKGLNFVGGAVGQLEIGENVTTQPLSGLTTRTFVRALSEMTSAGLFTGEILNNSSQLTITPSLYAQAVDDGKTGENSSMLIVYMTESNISNQNVLSLDDLSFSEIAFGLQGFDGTTFDNSIDHFISYIRRDFKEVENSPLNIITDISSLYYGEVCLVFENQVIDNIAFTTKGTEADLSITENKNLDNQMNSSTNIDSFFAYYFDATAAQSESDQASLAEIQQELNRNYNTLSMGSDFYPIVINGEITLSSLNSNILEIDQNGRMTIKGTGWVQVSGSSILNINDGVSFYIFVTNYFNNDSDISTIYPTSSSSTEPIDDFTLTMYANQSAMLYIRPNYSLDFSNLHIDETGLASLNNFYFNIAANTDMSAEVTITKQDEDSKDFDVSASGQTVVITANNNGILAQSYDVKVIPVIKSQNQNNFYTAYVNKGREIAGQESGINGKIDYRQGALGIGASRYDDVVISSGNQINETIVLRTTADLEDEGLEYYLTFNNQVIQSTHEAAVVENESMAGLLEITIGKGVVSSSEGVVKVYNFPLNITVDKESDAYRNRFNQNIYGEYKLIVLSKTNSSYYVVINIILENLPLQSILIDNYNNQDEMISEIGMESKYTYPGNSSLLTVNLLPDDSDFDYLTIENADQNYNSGSGVGTFSLAARKENVNEEEQENLFESSKITGSATYRGLLVSKDEILNLYQGEYQNYNGVIYFIYSIGNSGIVENSVSRFVVRVYNEGNLIQEQYIDLTLRLEEYISVSIEDKEPEVGTNIYYVARGLRYRLNIDSYGFNEQDIEMPIITAGSQYGEIIYDNGQYYLQITNADIGSEAREMTISVSATRQDDLVSAENEISLNVMQYVVDSSLADKDGEGGTKDIITGMVDGMITMPIGSSKTLSIDIYDYLEYDYTNQAVVSMVENFVKELTTSGDWSYYTNIAPGQSVPGIDAGQANYEYDLPVYGSGENYYFKYNNLSIVPLRINDAQANLYNIKYNGKFARIGSIYQAANNNTVGAVTEISTTVKFEVFVSSSEKSPIPIFDYQDFLNMHQDGYYILLNDIVLPSREYVENIDESVEVYTPQAATFASLDGNGHSIIWDGTYDMGSSLELGVFSSLATGSVIKNLNIEVLSSYDTGNANYGVVFATTSAEHRTGLLVGRNNGSITNCKVYSPVNTFFTVNCALADIESAYVGGLVGENNGFVTNCTSSINIYGSFNIGGVVGYNTGKIAASSFKEGVLRSSDNQVDEGFHVAGLVNVNATTGQIITSLVTGGIDSNSLYSTSTKYYLSGPNFSAGFVYENQGKISDCYSDINLQGSANMAGFVYVNTGNIKNSFSLSILQNNTIAAAGFAMRNTDFEEEQESVGGNENQANNSGVGIFENCYYLTDSDLNLNINLNPILFEGVEGLDIDDFGDINSGKFDSFAFTDYVSTSGVWFFTGNEQTNTSYISFEPTNQFTEIDNGNGIGVQVNTIYQITQNSLPLSRLELSAANIDTLSVRNFVDADIDEDTGDATYNYEYDISTDATRTAYRGSIYNSYEIYNASTMESLILENNSPSSNQNSANYRLIADIDYSTSPNSQIYQTVFTGNFEGNGMKISSIALQSNAQMQYAGLFAGLGVSSSRGGVIKNLVLRPSSVIFAGTVSVGGLVGYVNNGQIYNVEVVTTNSLTVQGSNFVGGVVGRAQGNYVFKNIYSNVNAVAFYNPDQDQSYVENMNSSVYSYAGSAFGHLGSGNAQNIVVENIISVRGDRAGLAIGGIGKNATVSSVEVTPYVNDCIKAYRYGGLVAGEIAGTLNSVIVSSDNEILAPFSIVGQLPIAVGGIVGLLNGGQINQVIMNQSFEVAFVASGSTYSSIENVGGLVGIVGSSSATISRINQAIVDASITARVTLGGAVGQVRGPVNIEQVAVKDNTLTLQGQTAVGTLGGLVGAISSNPVPYIEISNSYCQAQLIANISNALIQPGLNIGGLIAEETSNVNLQNCYTSSKMTIILNYLNSMQNYKSLSDLYTEGAGVDLYNQISSETKINNVYFFGAPGNAAANIVENFVSFSANFGISYGVAINGYGKDSYSYSGTGSSGTDVTVRPLYSCQFIDENDIWSEGGDKLKILNFENYIYNIFE